MSQRLQPFNSFSSMVSAFRPPMTRMAPSNNSLPFRPDKIPAGTTNLAQMDVSSRPVELMSHFARILTKHGLRGDDVLARVSASLRHKYGHPDPIQVAVDGIKPVLKYQRFKPARQSVPIVLHPKPSVGIAIRWIVDLASKRTYVGDRPCLERGLVDELDAIIQGTSPLYAKRAQFHKNPN